MTYAVRFDFPEGAVYAGIADGSYGFAPTLATAEMFEDFDTANRTMRNAYGAAIVEYGRVVEVGDRRTIEGGERR